MHRKGDTRSRRSNRPARGSASVEFIVMAPFVLLLTGMIWDLRTYISYHTNAVREMYVVAEMIANEVGPTTGASPIERVATEAISELAGKGAGRMTVAVVTRGDRRLNTDPAPDPACSSPGAWCLPLVTAVWPPTSDPNRGTWNNGGDCAAGTPSLPAPGEHFPADMTVLHGEVPADVSPAPSQDQWLSRNFREEEWWVVVETCFHPDRGLFGGMALYGLEFFDVSDSAFVLRKRVAWGSIHDYSWCNWCP